MNYKRTQNYLTNIKNVREEITSHITSRTLSVKFLFVVMTFMSSPPKIRRKLWNYVELGTTIKYENSGCVSSLNLARKSAKYFWNDDSTKWSTQMIPTSINQNKKKIATKLKCEWIERKNLRMNEWRRKAWDLVYIESNTNEPIWQRSSDVWSADNCDWWQLEQKQSEI